MLPVDVDTVRRFLHVLAAAVWVGGQLTLAGLVPALRPFGREVTLAAARRFNVVAWTSMAVLVATGIWNLVAVDVTEASDEYLTTLFVKLAAVAVTAGGAVVHVMATRPAGLAAGGALSSLGALAALFFGVVL